MSSDENNTIEDIYQKKTQLEHILLRPDSYVGSIKNEEKMLWIFDSTANKMVEKKITYNPALYKIFDEILVNASDNKIRDSKMSGIRIDIKAEKNMIRIWNNGKGIPVVMHKDVNVYVPTMIFGQLLTSTNFNDEKKQVTGGRNGYGAKLCNIFSTEFVLETSNKEYGKCFKQTWSNNMNTNNDPIISNCTKEDFTCVTFYPDLARFGMTHLDENIIALFSRRAYDIAACTNGVTVHLNGQLIPIKNFKDYVELYTKGCTDSNDEELKVIHEKYSDRWEVAITTSLNDAFNQVSFVNSIATTKGGTHVNYITDQASAKLLEIAKKKIKNDKQAVKLKPAQVKMNMWIFVKCLIENPSFDSQTKENMTLQAKDFGSTCILPDKFITQVSKCGIIEKITMWALFKNQALLDKKCSKTKQSKLKDIPKLDDANFAGTKNSTQCRLFLTEGDSAKTLAVSGLSVVGRDYYGIFPLRGKLLNVREASTKQLSDNAEITNLIKILGLQYQQKYESIDSLKLLRYGKLVLMTDQDQDGSHIKGLVINFIHAKWPNLLKHNFIEQFITPIIKVFSRDKREEISFYSIPEYEEWERLTPNFKSYRKKYYKGLGTSTSKEAKEYFNDMSRHLIKFQYEDGDGRSIVMAFAKDKADERKEWLTNNMNERRRRLAEGLDEVYLYGKGTKSITYENFINQELVLFSNTDNERSIPCVVDGFKPGQRKVLFACFKRNLVKEIKVAQLAGSVAELSAYHHGETSLMGTIINLAQDYVGSNNLNLLVPQGQFGTRLCGGKDSSSPRYIFTFLQKFTRMLFHPHDDPILKHLCDDNQVIEPEWYAPIIPMILVNGCDGIGTGWSSKIPNFNPKDVLGNIRRMLNKEPPLKMHPWYRGFRGTIQEVCENKYQVSGEISLLGDNCLEITELPIRTWTSTYKETVLEVFRNGSDKTPPMITDYKEYNTDTTVRFVVEMTEAKMAEAQAIGLHKYFKLQTPLTLSNMILFDEFGVIRKFNTPQDILNSFFDVRLQMYNKRKIYLIGMLQAEASKLENQARFILEKIAGTIIIENIKIAKLISVLIEKKYDSDPVKAWKKTVEKSLTLEKDNEDSDNDNEEVNDEDVKKKDSSEHDFQYLTCMRILDLTEEKKKELLANRDAKLKELRDAQNKSPEQFWIDDLDIFERELEVVIEQELQNKLDENVSASTKPSHFANQNFKKGGKRVRSVKVASETAPSKHGVRVEPKLEEEYLKKVNADVEKKKKQTVTKKQKSMMDNYFTPQENGDTMNSATENKDENDADDEPLTLAQRVAAKGSVVKDLVNKVKKPVTEKELNKFKEIKKKSLSPTKKKKRRMWESDSDGNMDGYFDDNLPVITDNEIIPRDSVLKRNAAKNVKYTQPDDDEESSPISVDDDSGSFKIEKEKPVQSSITSFLKKEDVPAVTKRKSLPKDKNIPLAKKAKLVKSGETKQAKNTAKSKPENKTVKEGKNEKRKSMKKKSPFSSDEDVANIFKPEIISDHGEVAENRSRRLVTKKVYVMSDEEDESDPKQSSDSEFDLEAEKAGQKRKFNV